MASTLDMNSGNRSASSSTRYIGSGGLLMESSTSTRGTGIPPLPLLLETHGGDGPDGLPHGVDRLCEFRFADDQRRQQADDALVVEGVNHEHVSGEQLRHQGAADSRMRSLDPDKEPLSAHRPNHTRILGSD